MADHVARGAEFEKKAEKKINGWGMFGSKFDDAADLYQKSANSFKLAKSWDRAGSVYIKLANCNLKLDSKHEAARAYGDAANCYKKTSTKDAVACFNQAVNLFLDMGRFNMAARYSKEIGELYGLEQNYKQAIVSFEQSAELFQSEEVTTSANQCKLKVAMFSATLGQYPKAIEIFEEIARHSLNINLLKYGVRGHLLNAGLCQLCKGDVVAINNSLERYQDLDLTFSRTREYKFLADLAAAIDEEDVLKFTDVVKEFDSMTPLDTWKTTLLLRVKEALKAKDNGGGHINHSVFWKNLAPVREGGGEPPHGSLGWAIDTNFGSLEALIQKMNAEGAALQGSGWVWLGVDKELKKLVIETTANQDPLVTKGGLVPLLGIDVWEHAYYLQYKNVRPDYLKNIWKVMNWKYASEVYEKECP